MENPPTEQVAPDPAAATSLAARLTNVFVAPGEVFDEVKRSPYSPANWIAPLVLACLAGIIYVFVSYSQPAVLQNLADARDKALQKQVAAGKLTQPQADQARATAERFMTPPIMEAAGTIGVIIVSAAGLFLYALVAWFLAKFALHAEQPYLRLVELVGLSSMIIVLGALAGACLVAIFGSLTATASPVLLLHHFDSTNKFHLVLATLNIFSIWRIGVLALGLSRLTGSSWLKPAAWLYVIWVCYNCFWIFLAAARQG